MQIEIENKVCQLPKLSAMQSNFTHFCSLLAEKLFADCRRHRQQQTQLCWATCQYPVKSAYNPCFFLALYKLPSLFRNVLNGELKVFHIIFCLLSRSVGRKGNLRLSASSHKSSLENIPTTLEKGSFLIWTLEKGSFLFWTLNIVSIYL